MRKPKLIAAVVLLILAAIVVLQNRESVQTEILWIDVEMPRYLLLLTTLGFGLGAGYLLATWQHRKKATAE